MRDTGTDKIKHWQMLDLLERKIRLRAEALCEERGPAENPTFETWLKATTEAFRSFDVG